MKQIEKKPPEIKLLVDHGLESKEAMRRLDEAGIHYERINCADEVFLPVLYLGHRDYRHPSIWWLIDDLVEVYGTKNRTE